MNPNVFFGFQGIVRERPRWNEILETMFPYLKEIAINQEDIHSIEGINRIYFPLIEIISLSNISNNTADNEITSVKTIRKITSQNLKEVRIGSKKEKIKTFFAPNFKPGNLSKTIKDISFLS